MFRSVKMLLVGGLIMINVAAALAQAGRKGDTQVGHLTPGEIVIPKNVIDNDPSIMSAVVRAFGKAGMDWRKFMVDERGMKGDDKINPQTGMPEYWGETSDDYGSPGAGAEAESLSESQSAYGGSEGAGGGGDSVTGLELSNPALPGETIESIEIGGIPGSSVTYGQPGGPAYQQSSSSVDKTQKPIGEALIKAADWAAKSSFVNPVMKFVQAGEYASKGLNAVYDALEKATTGKVTDRSNLFTGYEGSDEFKALSPAKQEMVREVVSRYSRPPEAAAPSYLSMGGMTSPQARSNIATYATQGSDSRYRDPQTWDYYKNLLQRALITEQGD